MLQEPLVQQENIFQFSINRMNAVSLPSVIELSRTSTGRYLNQSAQLKIEKYI